MRTLLLIFFVSVNFVYCQNIWELNYYSWNEKAYSIETITDSLIYLFSRSGTNDHVIYESNNQGKSWYLKHKLKLETYSYSMSCPDSNSIFITMRPGKIYRSLDGGKTFEFIQLDTSIMYQPENIKMFNKDTGIIVRNSFLITYDGWKSYHFYKYYGQNDSISFTFSFPKFINDSIVYCIVVNSKGDKGTYFCVYNINSLEYKLFWKNSGASTYDMTLVDGNYIFTCGKSNTISGGSGHDAIHKSTDGGKTWRRVLDLYSDLTKFYGHEFSPFGLQSIAFKDSLTGVAVGQFGKILYTYDGGESWIYEYNLHDSIYQPPTMLVRYAGSVPIIGTMGMEIYRMIEDNLAPKPEDTITISGRVLEGNKGQPGIPVVLGYRVTMTDSNGYYKFTRVAKGNYVVHAVNKYYDGGNPSYYYKPFKYVPERYDFYLTGDTSGIDFNAIDLRTFYTVSGEIITSEGEGLKDIPLTIGDSSTISTADGKFLFPKIEQNRTYELIPYSKEYKFTPWAYSINIDKDIDTFRFVATPITSVVENAVEIKNIIISPNPATDYITIILESWSPPSRWTPTNIEIYDMLGVKVVSETIHPMTSSHRMNVEKLHTGLYFLKIGNRVEKFVKI